MREFCLLISLCAWTRYSLHEHLTQVPASSRSAWGSSSKSQLVITGMAGFVALNAASRLVASAVLACWVQNSLCSTVKFRCPISRCLCRCVLWWKHPGTGHGLVLMPISCRANWRRITRSSPFFTKWNFFRCSLKYDSFFLQIGHGALVSERENTHTRYQHSVVNYNSETVSIYTAIYVGLGIV